MKKFGLSGIIGVAALFVFAVISAGCENEPIPNTGGGGNPARRSFSVSGTFTKSGEAGDEVRFELQSDAASQSVLNRAIAADSYTISGVLEDDDFAIRLKGSYDPTAGTWSVSAKSSNIIYTIDGKVDSAGVSQGSSATIAVKNGVTEEWVPYIFPVTEENVDISNAETVEESVAGGLPSFAQGYWRVNMPVPPGYSASISALISDWKIKFTGVVTSPAGSQAIDDSFTIVEYTDGHEIIVCYPEYEMTSANLAQAIAAYLGNGVVVIALEAPENEYVPGKWVYVTPDGSTIITSGFTEAEFEKLHTFFATGGWEKWAVDNGVSKVNKYSKFKLGFRSNNTILDMIYMVQPNPEVPDDYIVVFPSLAALKLADPSEVSTPDDGVVKMTLTR